MLPTVLYSHLMTRARVRTDLDVLRLAFSRCCGKSTTPTSSLSARSLLHSVILPLTFDKFSGSCMNTVRLEFCRHQNKIRDFCSFLAEVLVPSVQLKRHNCKQQELFYGLGNVPRMCLLLVRFDTGRMVWAL